MVTPEDDVRRLLLGAGAGLVVLVVFGLSLGAVFLAGWTTSSGPIAVATASTASPTAISRAATSATVDAATAATSGAAGATRSLVSSSTATSEPTFVAATTTPAPALATPSPATTTGAARQTEVAVEQGTSGAPASAVAPANSATSPAGEPGTATLVQDDFSVPASGWPTRQRATWRAGYVDGHYELRLNGQPNAGVSTAFVADQYRVSADVTISEGDAGLIYLSAEPATFYRFMISTDGMFALQMQQEGNDTATNLVEWTRNEALRRGADATNHLRIERSGATLRFFANDQPLTEWMILRGQFVNRYGFALSSTRGVAKASFDNLLAEQVQNR